MFILKKQKRVVAYAQGKRFLVADESRAEAFASHGNARDAAAAFFDSTGQRVHIVPLNQAAKLRHRLECARERQHRIPAGNLFFITGWARAVYRYVLKNGLHR